jgi:methyl-accepting chemotaxis protein
MAGKGLGMGRAHGNGASQAVTGGLSHGVASEFDRSMRKASYVDDIPVPVVVMDCEHNIEHLNGAAAMLAGRTVDSCIGSKMWELFDIEACRSGSCLAERAIREGRTVSGEAECLVQGRMMPIRAHVSPRFDEHNKIIGVVEVIEDNTQEIKLAEELSRLAKAARGGHFKERGDVEQFQGRTQSAIREVNEMLEANMDKLNWFQAILDSVPFPIHVLDKEMKWVFMNLAFEKLMKDASVIKDRHETPGMPCSTRAASICKTPNCGVVQLKKGVGESYFDWFEQSCKQNTSKLLNYKGEHIGYVEVVQDLTSIVRNKNYTANEVNRVAANLTRLAEGNLDLDLQIKEADQYTAEAKQQFDRINENMVAVKAAVEAMAKDAVMLSQAAVEGKLATRADASKHQGDFGKIVQGVNDTLDAVIGPLNVAAGYVDRISKGDIPEKITDSYNGDFNAIKNNLNQCVDAVNALIGDAAMLTKAAVEGKLATRADASKHQGDFRKIVQGVNDTLDAVVEPMQDVSAILTKLAGGDFTAVVSNNYAGDYELLANAVNTLSQSVRSALEQIGRNVSSLARSAEELNKVSESMGSNADETATQANVVSAAAGQVSNNVQTVATGAEEMGASIKEIAKNTAEATRVASSAVHIAEATNVTISKLGQSSAEIGQVIKVITSIAHQTNLLALNATIEAARAGEAGKGFAVVANEVKELAKETAKATEDISRKIEAIQGDTNGAVSAIGQISQVIGQISDIQTTIASAIEEQSATTNEIGRTLAEAAQGSTDISKNIGGVAEAAHATTVGATDTSKSAHALEKMAADLQSLVSQFRY